MLQATTTAVLAAAPLSSCPKCFSAFCFQIAVPAAIPAAVPAAAIPAFVPAAVPAAVLAGVVAATVASVYQPSA